MNSTVQVAQGTRTYHMKLGWKICMIFCGLLFGTMGVVGLWYFLAVEKPALSRAIFLASLFSGFVLAGIYCVLASFRSRAILQDDVIESSGVWITRTLRREDILGWRTLQQKNAPPTIVLVPKLGRGNKVKLNQTLDLDQAFFEWLGQFDDLDAIDAAASEQEILSSDEVGATTEERVKELAKARKISQASTAVAFLLLFWGILFPQPYQLVIALLSALPWCTLILITQSHGLYRLDEKKNDAHPNLVAPFIMPGFALLLRAAKDFELVSWSRPAAFGFGAAIVMTVVAAVSDKSLQQRKVALISLLVCSLAYGFGATLQANALLDKKTPQLYSTEVIDKHISHGKHTTYELKVEPWGPVSTSSEVTISKELYQDLQPGDPVCIELHPGALEIPWYMVEPCD